MASTSVLGHIYDLVVMEYSPFVFHVSLGHHASLPNNVQCFEKHFSIYFSSHFLGFGWEEKSYPSYSMLVESGIFYFTQLTPHFLRHCFGINLFQYS